MEESGEKEKKEREPKEGKIKIETKEKCNGQKTVTHDNHSHNYVTLNVNGLKTPIKRQILSE